MQELSCEKHRTLYQKVFETKTYFTLYAFPQILEFRKCMNEKSKILRFSRIFLGILESVGTLTFSA